MDFNPEQQQAIATRDGHICIIAGAGSGKCLTGDALLLSRSFGFLPISKIAPTEGTTKQRTEIVSFAGSAYEPYTTSHVHRLKANKVIRVKTKAGYELTGTPEHPIVVLDNRGDLNWKKLNDILPGDIAALSIDTQIFSDAEPISQDLAYVLGLLVGDGCLSSPGGTIGLSKNHKLIEQEYRRIILSEFGYDHIQSYAKKGTGSVTLCICSVEIKTTLAKLGLKMATAAHKEVPSIILSSSKSLQVAFLQGLFDTDSGVNGCTIEYSTASRTLGIQVQLMLLNMGIRITRRDKVVNGTTYYRMAIMGHAARQWIKQIGFRFATEKTAKLTGVSSKSNSNTELIPNQQRRFAAIQAEAERTDEWDKPCRRLKKTGTSFKDYLIGRRSVSRKTALAVADALPCWESQQLRNLASNFLFDEVAKCSIEQGNIDVFDMTVPTHHNFCANGFVNHNTRVLTERLARMVEEGVPADIILAFTFTRKAANEMKERLEIRLSPGAIEPMFVGTMHSLFYWIIREDLGRSDKRYLHGMTLAKDWQQRRWIADIHKEFRFVQLWQSEAEARKVIGKLKNLGLHPNDAEDYLASRGMNDECVNYHILCYEEYEQRKRNDGMIDFDDMLLLSRDLFRNNPDVLSKWQERYQYISIDEYQDINPVQEELIHLLQLEHGNLFVVGDARQAVYGFRGSDPSFILKFKDKYPDSTVISMFRNYRCGKIIMDHANALISINVEGREPMKAELPLDGTLTVLPAQSNGDDEANDVIQEAFKLHGLDDLDWGDMAVLYRCNYQSRPIEDACIKMQIPYEIIGSEGFYGRTEIKDMLAYVRIAAEGEQTTGEAVGRIVNKPTRYLGKVFMEEWERERRRLGGALTALSEGNYSANSRSRQQVTKLSVDLRSIVQMGSVGGPSAIVRYVRRNMGYDEWFLANRSGEEMEEIEALANLEELQLSAGNFKSCQAMLNYVDGITAKRAEDSDQPSDRVKLMSLHRAKGLEFRVVFVTGMNNLLLPHKRAEDQTEERRLAYVGVTRAKERLYLSYFTEHRGQTAGASPFFSELGIHLDNLEEKHNAIPIDDKDPDDGEEYIE